jgi:iron complex outermembrane receptor protein
MLAVAIVLPDVATAQVAETPVSRAVEDETGDDDIIVTGRAAQLYRVEETQSGRLPTQPLASSQSITVITDDLIRDQGARDAQDLYRNISGVSLFSYAGVTARGFRQEDIFYDGLRGDPYAGFSVPQLFNIERVEFLKGPAGMLYGPGAPGGLFNYITRRPTFDGSGNINLVAGTESRYGGSVQLNGPVNDWLAVAGGTFYEDRNLPRIGAGNETLILDGGLTFRFGAASLTVQGTRYEQNLDGNRLRGVPVDAQGRFLTGRRWNHNEATDFLDLESSVAQAIFEAQPTETFSFDIRYRYNQATEEQQYHEPRGLFDTNRDGVFDTISREFRDQVRTQETHSLGGNLIWTQDFGWATNRVLAGFDYFFGDFVFDSRLVAGTATTVSGSGRPTPLSIQNPVYGTTDSRTYVLPAFTRTLTSNWRFGYYVLNELTLGPVILTAGIRRDEFQDRSGLRQFTDADTTYRLGAVWRIRDDVSLYGQYATSFEPQSVASQDPRAGGPFEPTTGDIIEGGLRTGLFNGRLQSTLAAYRIRRQNLLQADPRGDVGGDGINDQVAFGEVTSKGIEFDLATDITDDWVLTLAYAYNDTRITATNGRTTLTNSVGDRFANAPEHQLGFWTRYQFPSLGLALAIGGDYISERISLSNQPVRPYFVFDASATLVRGPWNLLVRVDNLFDRVYAASGFIDRAGHFPGEPRSLFVEASYRF